MQGRFLTRTGSANWCSDQGHLYALTCLPVRDCGVLLQPGKSTDAKRNTCPGQMGHPVAKTVGACDLNVYIKKQRAG